MDVGNVQSVGWDWDRWEGGELEVEVDAVKWDVDWVELDSDGKKGAAFDIAIRKGIRNA